MTAVLIADTEDMARDEWLALRKRGLGGSDAGTCLGLNKFCSPYELWLDKTGRIGDQDLTSEAAEWGNKLEQVVADEFALRAGLKVWHPNGMYRHPEHNWMFANPDRYVEEDGQTGLLECKTASIYLRDKWGSDAEPLVPESYDLQVRHYLAVLDLDWAYIACLVGGQEFLYRRIERDLELETDLIEIERVFWNEYVLTDEPPPVSAQDNDTLNGQWVAEEGKEIILPSTAKALLAERQTLKANAGVIDERVKRIEAQIKSLMGDAEIGFCEGEKILTWKKSQTTRLNAKLLKEKAPKTWARYAETTEGRTFRPTKIEES